MDGFNGVKNVTLRQPYCHSSIQSILPLAEFVRTVMASDLVLILLNDYCDGNGTWGVINICMYLPHYETDCTLMKKDLKRKTIKDSSHPAHNLFSLLLSKKMLPGHQITLHPFQ